MNKPKILMVSGFARAGKDTFTTLLRELCNRDYIKSYQFSFAEELKRDLEPIIWKMGIDIINPTDEQKKIIRPILISYGCAWRSIDINHWVKKVDYYIDGMKDNCLYIITDNRFISETQYFIDKYGRENVLIVEVTRTDGPPPPNEELENQPKIREIADAKIVWETDPTLKSLTPIVRDFYETYIK